VKIGIDATGIWGLKDGLLNGIMRYTIHLINNLIEIDKDNQYYIYCRDEIPVHLNREHSSVTFRVFKSRNRKILQQVKLPIAALCDRLDLMFFPYHSASLLSPCTSIVVIHDLHPFVIPQRYEKIHSVSASGKGLVYSINKIYWEKMLRWSAKKMDGIIAVSQATKKDIVNIFGVPPEKVYVTYEGVDRSYFNTDTEDMDPEKFRKKYNLPDRYILCVGTHAYKNIEGIIKTIHILKNKYSDTVKVVIAGNKAYLSDDIFELIARLELEDQIIFTGFFPGEDLKHLYHCAELFLFPSFYEGFGLPILEAFACGIPVVTSTAGALPEVAGDAALLADPDDPDEIASAVNKLLSDNHIIEEKRQKGFEQVEKFSWEESARLTLDLFTKLL
jgi:glycosyltransferase involved in cell wall biosynthesis